MKDLEHSLDSMNAAKKVSLEHKIDALQQLILQRYQALTTISSISFAVAGAILSLKGEMIKNRCLAIDAVILFLLVAVIGLGRHLYLIRSDIGAIAEKIKNLPNEDWNNPLPEKEFKADWWPETLFIIFVVGISLFGLSLIQ